MILNFSQECYYLKNKVGVVDFTKARGLVKFQKPAGPSGSWALKHYQSLGVCKIYYSHFIFEVMYHCLLSFLSYIGDFHWQLVFSFRFCMWFARFQILFREHESHTVSRLKPNCYHLLMEVFDSTVFSKIIFPFPQNS